MPFPVDELLPQLIDTLVQQHNVVLQAPPGAGKTTRVPLALLGAKWLGKKKIIMLEPRRIAARAAARFMAKSLGESVGQTVGYRVRLDNKTGPNTRIEVVTEGILTRMLQDDPALENVGIVIFDEFHERNLNSDLGLALCLDAQQGLRDDLRLLVMSATLDESSVAKLLGDAPVLTSEGRSYPVEIHYQPVQANFARDRRGFLQGLTRHILTALKQEEGSALVFLPGVGEIRQVYDSLQASQLDDDIILAPLFGQLTAAEQDAAIQPAPAGKRKLVLATAIAETSLTIEGIRIVIDSGLMRTPRFDPSTGLTRLVTLPVSQANADQRSGRAGRTQAGVCYRLWSASTHLLSHSNPEIIDADLAPLMLELAQWGVADANMLRWLNAPPAPHVAQARALLQQLGALDTKGKITKHGESMAQWGAHPRLAHMMLRAKDIKAGTVACEVAALLNERDVMRGRIRESDLRLRIEALRDRPRGNEFDQAALRQVREIAKQWQAQLKVKTDSTQDDLALTGVVLAYAYPDRIGLNRDNTGGRDNSGTRYLLSNGRGAMLNEGDMLSTEEFIVAAHLDGSREARIFLAAGIHREQLLRHHSDLLQERYFVSWDDRSATVQARRQQCMGEVIITDKPWLDADPDAIEQALQEGIRTQGLTCLPWNDTARELQARTIFLHDQLSNDWPDFSNAALLQTLDKWLSPYLTGMSRLSHLQQLDMHSILMACLSWEQQSQLKALAPTHITVPSGSNVRLDYSHSPPVLAVRLQEMFGLTDTPHIANGKVAVLLHLLSPARRPVQITQDLAGFWQSSYHEVKKDLKGRYPKHHWPDDPLQAQATARVKRKGGD
ncbi:MAG: ATP-dependent helicase HrpB [Gammaproteobacteria bacterium]|nr:ATP-dependent helicase HrpB [Gammaproteobacteria bacterium]